MCRFFLKICSFKDLGPFKFQPHQVPDNLKVRTLKANDQDSLVVGDQLDVELHPCAQDTLP
jgi:hypothetical protein